MAEVKRPALRYYGAKWNLAPWVIGHFGAHEVYVEPFGGSAAVLLRKERSLIEVYNDLDLEVVNFFYVLRAFPERLMELVWLTPFALSEFTFAQSCAGSCRDFLAAVFVPERPFDWVPYGKDIEKMIEAARLFYVRSTMGMTGPTAKAGNGFRRQKVFSRGRHGDKRMTPASVSFMQVGHLRAAAERLRGVTIENVDAADCLRRYDGKKTLFYVDPPYPRALRERSDDGYRHEMNEKGHEALLGVLKTLEGQVVVSGYESELYGDLLRGWGTYRRKARINGAGSAVEVLWVNEAAVKARKGYSSLPLFRGRS